jgi:flagellar basal-body rod protein FlgC
MVFKSLEISLSALIAERERMNIISSNLANINSTKEGKHGPYTRRRVTFKTGLEEVIDEMSGDKIEVAKVKVDRIIKDAGPYRLVYDPTNPDADKNGYVKYPNVNPVREMVDMIDAMRVYQANLTAFNNNKAMIQKALEIGKA